MAMKLTINEFKEVYKTFSIDALEGILDTLRGEYDALEYYSINVRIDDPEILSKLKIMHNFREAIRRLIVEKKKQEQKVKK